MNKTIDQILAIEREKKAIKTQKIRAEADKAGRWTYGFLIAWFFVVSSLLLMDYFIVHGIFFDFKDDSFRYFNASVHLVVMGFIFHDEFSSINLKLEKIWLYIDAEK